MAREGCGCSGIRHCLVCETTPECTETVNQINKGVGEYLDTNLPDIFHFCLISSKIDHGEWQDCLCSSKQEEFSERAKYLQNDGLDASAKPLLQNIIKKKRLVESENEFVLQFVSPEGDLTDSPLLLGVEDIVVMENFITESEEEYLRKEIYKLPWKLSQSGRRKQDFGPQANFKRRKLKIGNFTGLPFFLKDAVSKMKSTKLLADFSPVEVCHLEYSPIRGSSIDPHIDDRWLWGERLVTVNLLSSTMLTLSHNTSSNIIVQVPLPRRSLMVLQGKARHIWKHSIHRKHIFNLRLALTFRELSEEFVSGNQANCGNEVLKIASNFNGRPLYNAQNCK